MLQAETGSVNGGDHSWFNRSTGEERSVTRDSSSSSKNIIMIMIIIVINYLLSERHALSARQNVDDQRDAQFL